MEFVPGKTVEVPAIPFADEARLRAADTALIIVDMQNDFVKPGGKLVTPDAMDTVPRIRALIESARAADVRIAYTQDTHLPGDKEWGTFPEHVRVGTWGWEIVDELKPQPKDLVCQKNRYDGFYGTWLDHYLCHVWGVSTVVIVGTVSNICVMHTAASAGMRWFRLIVPADGISALTLFDQAMTLRQVSWLYPGKVVRSTKDIVFEQ